MVTIAIDARLVDGQSGGVQQAIFGLATGLSKLADRGDRYLFLVFPEHEWLKPALVGPSRPLVVRSGDKPARSPVRRTIQHLVESRGRILPASDGTAEGAGADLIHFMLQRGFRTTLPNIYQPHDLQHVHHPERFGFLQRSYRRLSYPAMARQASRVAVMAGSSRDPTAAALGVPPSKVIVVPWASVMSLYGVPALPRPQLERLGVPRRFLLYPAYTWIHKNHLGLTRALEVLHREFLMDVPVVLTGGTNSYWREIAKDAERRGVANLVVKLGFVSPSVLRSLYAAAEALVFPSLYEGWGHPVVEAMDVGLPVLCSDISPLREIAAGAALTFDPHDSADLAAGIRRIWTEERLRRDLATRGRARAQAFSWQHTAALFRAHYRDVLGLPLLDEDAELLRQPPLA